MAIVGMTGIGKTTLAERVVANMTNTTEAETLPYYRFSLDDRSLTPDFASSGAALLRALREEPTLADQQDPANLVNHLLQRLNRQPCRLQIDSLERLLRGNEQEGWSEFCDPLWLDLLQKFLAGTGCPSQLILTSQDIPGDLDAVASRYPQFWYCEPLQGLPPDEQRTLFQNLGLTPTDADWELLERIGTFYDGHPLVLQVIAEEIRQRPFLGNIRQYWHHYEAEFTTTAPATATKLDRSRLFRRRVRQRVEQTIQRLPEPARQMLCASAVFRRPVPITFWEAMLTDDDPQQAFDTLVSRSLVEYAPTTDSTLLIRQHNLVRSVAYALLKTDTPIWETAEGQAAHLWLTEYQPVPDVPNLEKVRGYLEAFDHYCLTEDWEKAGEIFIAKINFYSSHKRLDWHLETWGYYQEKIQLCERILGKVSQEIEVIALKGIGNAYLEMASFLKAIEAYQESLHLARQAGDRMGEERALGNIGKVYYILGDYSKALHLQRKRLIIAREIGDRSGEGGAMGCLGDIYYQIGQYSDSAKCHQKDLEISREINDCRGEIHALQGLARAFCKSGKYSQSIDNYQVGLNISHRIGDLLQEGRILCRLGALKTEISQHSEALKDLQGSLAIFRSINNKVGEAEAIQQLAKLHQTTGEIEVARQYCQQALTLATALGIPLKAECEELLQQLKNSGGDHEI